MIVAAMLLACAQSDLVAGEAKKLAGDMKFVEGPVVDAKGHVYYSDIPANRIMVWDGKENKVWRENSGGANGIKIDKDGSLIVCEGGARRITRISTADQKVIVLCDAFNGKKLNSPNDVAIDAKGGLYFTDPRYGKKDDVEQDKEAVYYLSPGGGAAVRVAADLVRPNGVHIDKDRIYVADHGDKKVYVYSMNVDGTLKDKKEFAPVGCDGLKVDEKGNVYTTTGKGVEIFAPDGKPLGVIAIPEGPANCAFGGKTLYVTARKSLYSVEMKVAGN